MRTTLTLDDDVAIRLEEIRLQTGTPLKDIVNRALRVGLERVGNPTPDRKRPFRTRPMSLGRCLVPSLDDISAVIEQAEGIRFR